MFLKALLVCDDVRFEQAGAMSLIGVHRERLAGIATSAGGIQFPKFFGVAMLGGLTGITEIQHRWQLRAVDSEIASRERPYESEPRDGSSDEHVFVFGNAPLVFPHPGRFEVLLDVIAMGKRASYNYLVVVDALRARADESA
ncbi:hypothetical protein BH11MYX2_BH11MYX2_11880 [soil metagenome]